MDKINWGLLISILIQTGIVAQTDAFKIIGKIHIETPFADQGDFNKWYYDSPYYESTD